MYNKNFEVTGTKEENGKKFHEDSDMDEEKSERHEEETETTGSGLANRLRLWLSLLHTHRFIHSKYAHNTNCKSLVRRHISLQAHIKKS